ncbi:MAG: FecR domain-containing protein [Rhodothermales bacterium]
MSTPLPDNDRDLRLARRLDAGEAADGSDALHDALRSVQPAPAAPDAGEADRLWAGIAAEIGTAPSGYSDRPPLRLVRPRVMRWAVAAVVLVGFGVWAWFVQSRPELVAVATTDIVTWEASDGSTVTLRPNSWLIRLDDERTYRLKGEAFFDVAHDPDAPFTVEAGPAAVRVLGTRFDVSTWGEVVEVFVEEGRVEVRADAEAVVLGAGEAAEAGTAGVRVLPTASADTFLDWQRGEIVFEREPVRRVADELAQHFGIAIVLPADAARESISGVIVLESAAQTLGDLGTILGGRFERDGSGGYQFLRP